MKTNYLSSRELVLSEAEGCEATRACPELAEGDLHFFQLLTSSF